MRSKTKNKSLLLPALIFDFSWQFKRKTGEPGRIEGVVGIAIPYSCSWFKEEEGILKTENLTGDEELRKAMEIVF